MQKFYYLLLLGWLITACNASGPADNSAPNAPSTNSTSYEDVSIDDYTVENVPGTNWQKATKVDTAGNIAEVGYFENGKRVGAWVTFHQGKLFPAQLSNYKNGKLNGLHMQFNQGGQTEVIAYYQDNNLHGQWAKFRFSRVLEEAEYKYGKLDGTYRAYNLQDGKLQKTAEYKNGVQDGYYRTFDSDGNMTTEYLYRNGQQISGGATR